MTWPGKTGLIYTKYTCSYYGTYLLFCMCYSQSVSFIEFFLDFFTYDDVLDTIRITDKNLLHFKLSQLLGKVLYVDKASFSRPSHIYSCIHICMYVYVHIYVCGCMCLCMYVCVCHCVRVCHCVCVVCECVLYVSVCTVCMYICMLVCSSSSVISSLY